VFEESSDPFGRVTVYTLDIIGTPFAGWWQLDYCSDALYILNITRYEFYAN
jgi:hypothetical protein